MRFIASFGDSAGSLDPPGPPPSYSADCLSIWSDQPVQPIGQSGAVLIGVIRAWGDGGRASPNGSLSALTSDGWGDYVAVKPGCGDDPHELLVSPSGGLPCYIRRTGKRIVIGSNAMSVLRVSGGAIEVDWDAVAMQLRFRTHRSRSTAIRDLEEIPAGCLCRVTSNDIEITPAWTPGRERHERPSQSIAESARLMRSRVQGVISASGRNWRRGLIGISGGLDSSIVAAACLTAGIEFDCFTMYSEGDEADERDYARLLARALGKSLTERPYRFEDIDLSLSSVASLPRPIGWPFQQSLDAACDALTAKTGADIVVRGTGGDAIFYGTNTAAPVVDSFLCEGPIGGMATLLDICRLHGCSLWTASRLSARKLLYAFRERTPKPDEAFLIDSERVRLRPIVGWDLDYPRIPPGKREHVAMIAATRNFVEARLVLACEVACPLYSQPVIEAALTVPSSHWVHGGRDRAVARLAFEDRLPREIIRRRTKGGPSGFAAKLFQRSRKEIRERLLDGNLVQHGIVNGAAVARATEQANQAVPDQFGRLLELVDAEAWCQRWSRQDVPDVAGLPMPARP